MVVHSKKDLLLSLGLGYLGQFLGSRMNELVIAGCKKKGFGEMRESHGYVIQHLVERDRPVSRTGTELARRMGVTQQAASKTIADLVRMGVVELTGSKDRRAKQVCLTSKGWAGVQQARAIREHLEERLRQHAGTRKYSEAQQTLRSCLELLGSAGRIRGRRIRQPDQ